MEKDKPKLEPCPFCGAIPVIEQKKLQKEFGGIFVPHQHPCFFCYHGYSGYWIDSGAEAAWNRRAK